MSTDTQSDRPFTLPGDDDEELRLTIHTEAHGTVQAWGRVIGSAWCRDANSDGPYTLMSLTLNGRAYAGRLREALLEIQDMHDHARGTRQVALANALAVLTAIQPVDDSVHRPAPDPAPEAHLPLTSGVVSLLNNLCEATNLSARVKFLLPGCDDPITGTLRHIVKPDSDTFLTVEDDLRDGRVRITGTLGADYYLPVLAVLDQMAEGSFVIDA